MPPLWLYVLNHIRVHKHYHILKHDIRQSTMFFLKYKMCVSVFTENIHQSKKIGTRKFCFDGFFICSKFMIFTRLMGFNNNNI